MKNFEISVDWWDDYFFDRYKIDGINYYWIKLGTFSIEWETGGKNEKL
jgi:hypothetical protein